MQYTPEQLQRIYLIARNARWRYKLDTYEDEALKTILSTLQRATGELERKIVSKPLTAFQADRMEAMLVEFDSMSAAARAELSDGINEVAAHAGEWAVTEHSHITSFGGLAAGFNTISLAADQFRQFFSDTPLGGKSLASWVDAAFDSTTKAALREAINSGVLQGEGYRQLIKRALREAAELLRHEAITLTRTYVQSANVAAQQAVYQANADIVERWEWCATLEPGYKNTGRGTCVRCAALDGQIFELGKGPACPLHPRCRCVAIPVTKTWRELGIDLDEMEEVARPYTMRPDASIDAGGKRTIIESGFHDGDYGSWFSKQSRVFQENAVGPKRAALLRAGKVEFHDLVDGNGRLRTLEELGWSAFAKDVPRASSGLLGVRGRKTLEKAVQERLGGFARRGIHSVEFVDESYFMATDSLGRIRLSTREFPSCNGFCPAYDLEAALRKLGTGERLTFNQEYAVESLWHEVNHNRQIVEMRPARSDIRTILMETVTQWTSRRSYQEAIAALGGTGPQHQAKVIASGYGYAHLIRNMDRLVNALGIRGEDVFDDVYEMMKTVKRYSYEPVLSKILAKASGKGVRDIGNALRVIDQDRLFEERLGRFL